MSRLTRLMDTKNIAAKSIAGYCAKHPCPPWRMCEGCILAFQNRFEFQEFIDALVQIEH